MRNQSLLFSIILFITVASYSTQAQFLPQTGDKQVVLGMQGLSGNSGYIMLRKFKSETISNRYGLIVRYAFSSNSNTSSNSYSTDSKSFNNSLSFYMGKQKNFNISEKFVPYIALDLGIGESYNYQYQNSSLSDTLLYNQNNISNTRTIKNSRDNTTKNLTLNLFVSPTIGFNYYLGKNFAVGAEYVFTLFNVGYTVVNTQESNQDYKELTRETIYNNTTNTYDVVSTVTGEPYSQTSKNNYGVNLTGGISGNIFLTASYYFK